MASGFILMDAPDVQIDIARDFHPYPVGRFSTDGDYNGTRFREEILVPKLREALAGHGRLSVSLDGVRTFASSFLEEAFGGLVREDAFSVNDVERTLKIVYNKPYLEVYARLIRKYIHEAHAAKQ